MNRKRRRESLVIAALLLWSVVPYKGCAKRVTAKLFSFFLSFFFFFSLSFILFSFFFLSQASANLDKSPLIFTRASGAEAVFFSLPSIDIIRYDYLNAADWLSGISLDRTFYSDCSNYLSLSMHFHSYLSLYRCLSFTVFCQYFFFFSQLNKLIYTHVCT